MSDEVIIRVEGLGKKYRLGQRSNERYTALRDVIANSVSAPFRRLRNGRRSKIEDRSAVLTSSSQLPSTTTSSASDFWALRNVSFEVRRGEVVGIIGRNGAGKSTLLKILSRITEPTEGRVRIRGRVASLLEVGTGFHPELTGRENIYLNGAILGMTRVEIQKKFDEIVDFAEIEKFLETPVKRYSSGMYVRLAFAVAAHLEPEILVVDEVLAVGDAEFQKKCLGKMESVATREGRTVLFVSHNMEAVRVLCTKAINLEMGHIRASGSVMDVINDYLRFIETGQPGSELQTQLGTGLVLERLSLDPPKLFSGDPLNFRIELRAARQTRIKELAVIILSQFGARIAILDLREVGIKDLQINKGPYVISGVIRAVPLIEGAYRVGLYVVTDDYRGDLLDLAQFHLIGRQQEETVRYAPMYRGLIDLQFDVSVPDRKNQKDIRATSSAT